MKKEQKLKSLDNLFKVKNNSPGKVIRAFRQNFNISQKELCHITGINEPNLSAIENEKRDIGVHTAKKIAAFFSIDPGSILFPNGTKDTFKEHSDIRKKAARLLESKKIKP